MVQKRNASLSKLAYFATYQSSEEAYDLPVNAPKNKDKLSTAPPVQPEGGTVFLYNLGENSKTWDLQKRQIMKCIS